MRQEPTAPNGEDVARIARDILADSSPRLAQIGTQRVHDQQLGTYDEPVYGPGEVAA